MICQRRVAEAAVLAFCSDARLLCAKANASERQKCVKSGVNSGKKRVSFCPFANGRSKTWQKAVKIVVKSEAFVPYNRMVFTRRP